MNPRILFAPYWFLHILCHYIFVSVTPLRKCMIYEATIDPMSTPIIRYEIIATDAEKFSKALIWRKLNAICPIILLIPAAYFLLPLFHYWKLFSTLERIAMVHGCIGSLAEFIPSRKDFALLFNRSKTPA